MITRLQAQRNGDELWSSADEFRSSVTLWAEKIRVRPSRIQIRDMRQKWASCSRTGIVTFSRDLLSRSREFGEAVIVHELIHLRVRNHGQLFRSLFRAFLPNGEASLNGHFDELD